MAVAGQQHGLVALDEHRAVVRPALLWNDTRSAPAALDLVEEAGGPQAYADAAGSVPSNSFTVTKLRWLAEHEPDAAARVRSVLLPHDWLTARLLGDGDLTGVQLTTDRGDASGTGYWSPAAGEYRTDLLARALRREDGTLPDLPAVLGPREAAGRTPGGVLVAPGTGDNMGAALGLALGPGDLVVSLGTSGTVFGVSEHPTADASGIVAGFADATGHFLPLVCTLNAARVLTAAAAMHGTDLAGLERLALRRGRGRRAHPAALPRRRADPGPARGDRHPRRPHPRQRHPGEPRAAAVEGCCAGSPTASTRCVTRRRRPPGPAHRRGRALDGGAGRRPGSVRGSGAGARAGGVRRPRGRPAGRVGALRRAGAPTVGGRDDRPRPGRGGLGRPRPGGVRRPAAAGARRLITRR